MTEDQKSEVLSFLESNKVCVLGLEISSGVHCAVMHFAFDPENLEIVFLTSNKTRKFSIFSDKADTSASVVVGTDGDSLKTLQLDGRVTLDVNLSERFKLRFPDKKIKDDSVFLKFVPNWWQYTDWTKNENKVLKGEMV
jgi:uncharacterized protein YhbP (UPF0306 family)